MRRHAAAHRHVPRHLLAGRSHRKALLMCASALLGLALVLALGQYSYGQDVPVPRTVEDPSITPVAGPSWLHRRSVPDDRTNLGAATRGPLATDENPIARRRPLAALPGLAFDSITLYRLNCLACHGERSLGAAQASLSILRAVEGSSLDAIRERLQKDLTAADLERLVLHGSDLMPARDHMKREDLETLSAYLTQTAAPAEGGRRARRVNSWAQLGEHVVKGTCHICHDAVGPHPSPANLQPGEIPSLDALLAMKSVSAFIRKVRSGSPVMSGEPGLFHAGRMPTFSYLRDVEIAAAYVYLAKYPPMALERR
jgi:mono/diheme cytochrome c family protein